jgi:hypothetical protein
MIVLRITMIIISLGQGINLGSRVAPPKTGRDSEVSFSVGVKGAESGDKKAPDSAPISLRCTDSLEDSSISADAFTPFVFQNH